MCVKRTQPSRVRVAIWEAAKWLLCIAILLFGCLAPFGWVNRLIPIAALARHVRAVLATLPVVLIILGRDLAAILLVRPALFAGDYERAMRWVRRLSFGRPSARLIVTEGRIHALANRPAEAELCYRQALTKSYSNIFSSRSSRAALADCLGDALQAQGRYEEAKKCLQGGIEMGDDDEASSRVDLAQLLLERESEPAKALELTDEAMRVAKGRVAAKVEPLYSATRAWALALLGRRQEADEAIERATRVRRDTHAALFANTRLNAGMALLAMDQPEKAIEHFRAVHEADRDGKYGALALQQLKQHSVLDQ